MQIEVYRKGQGWLPASDEAIKVRDRMENGDIAWFKTMKVRCPKDLRRFWQLMTMCRDNCERIEMPHGGVMLVNSKEDVCTVVKICTGHCTTIFDMDGKPVYQIPKSISFENMEQNEWDEFWPRVVDVVMQRIMPGVSLPEIELELLKCMKLAA
jgi:ferredoxin